MQMILIVPFILGLLFGPAHSQPAPGGIPGCVYLASNITLSSLQTTAVRCDINGRLLISSASGIAPSGPAGGDLTGTYPNPTIKTSVSLTTPNINVATGTSLVLAQDLTAVNAYFTKAAIGGAAQGSAAFAVTGTAAISGNVYAPKVFFDSGLNTGIDNSFSTQTQIAAWANGTNIANFVSTGLRLASSATISFSSAGAPSAAANDVFLSRSGAASLQFGAADAAVAVAQTLRVQSVVAGTAAANGANWTLIGSLPTGTGTSGDIIFQTGVKTGSGTTQGTATTALTIKGETQGVIVAQNITATTAFLTTLPSDSGTADNSVCVDATGRLLKGSGVAGICLGTSSARYKNHIFDLVDSALTQIVALRPVSYFYNKGYGDDGASEKLGFTAEDVVKVAPKLVGLDGQGRPNTVDMVGMIPVMVKAMQEQQAEINDLKRRVN